MFLAPRGVVPGEKLAPEIGQHGGHIMRSFVTCFEKIPDTPVALLHAAQGQDEIAQVLTVEGAVDIGGEQRQFALRGVAHEIRRGVVHEMHHAVAAADNGFAVAPRDGGGEKTRNLPVGTLRVTVRHRNRVVGDEFGTVVFVVQGFEQLPQVVVRESFHRTW